MDTGVFTSETSLRGNDGARTPVRARAAWAGGFVGLPAMRAVMGRNRARMACFPTRSERRQTGAASGHRDFASPGPEARSLDAAARSSVRRVPRLRRFQVA